MKLLFIVVLALMSCFQAFAVTHNLDSTFGTNGSSSIFINGTEWAQDVLIQPNGKIIIAGVSKVGVNRDFALSRLNSDGSLDIGFGAGGKVLTSFSDLDSDDYATAVALQTDGKIVLAGRYQTDSVSYVALARYNPDGSLDMSFDSDGKVIAESVGMVGVIYDVALQADGKIVVAGWSSGAEFTVVRFNTDGTPDTSFDGDGKATTTFGTGGGQAHTIEVQADGKIIVGGYTYISPANTGFALVRYNPNGSLDSTFGNSGKTAVKINSSQSQDTIYSLAVQPDGKILAVGGVYSNGTRGTNSALARFNPDGSLDTSFGVGGKVITALSDQQLDLLTDLVLQTDGKFMVSGYRETGGAYLDLVVGRYNADGTPDSSFGIGGFAVTEKGGNGLRFVSIALQADRKPVAAVTREGGFFVTRYPANGFRNFDFDGDAKSDISVFRSSSGMWFMQQSVTDFNAIPFGQAGDKLVPADFDGDDKTDIGVYRNGTWHLLCSVSGYRGVQFGAVEDIPQPADFDGDGRAELAVYRPSDGTWYTLNWITDQFNAVQFGIATDKPVASDYDGDGRADYAVFRPGNGTWYLLRSQTGFKSVQFGTAADRLVPADYDGDGKTDLAFFRPSNGTWYIQKSIDGFSAVQFGAATDIPTPIDFDGDGKMDMAVYRDGTWFILKSSNGAFTAYNFGNASDTPVPSAYFQ